MEGRAKEIKGGSVEERGELRGKGEEVERYKRRLRNGNM